MNAHDLAALLLTLPNIPVIINGWGSDEGRIYAVSSADECSLTEHLRLQRVIELNYTQEDRV